MATLRSKYSGLGSMIQEFHKDTWRGGSDSHARMTGVHAIFRTRKDSSGGSNPRPARPFFPQLHG